ncbi:hypothetical protein A0H81_14338 [Grifola frondosa]|uniref:Sedoheptulose 1,7-bisphosphatase n=1 Tax=Grifola frondosa TaxID=5627 RepID=A0A1C7LNJ6_GRIFR|nr:hypothetical protein A0H81_14338 [Grifola frondosa]
MVVVARVYIVRHGETEENKQGIMQGQLDTVLNAAGEMQARHTARALEEVPFELAYSSDLSRAVKTAEIILEKHPGVRLEKHEALRERGSGQHMGDWQGRSVYNRGEAPENMEAVVDFMTRGVWWWKEVVVRLAQSIGGRGMQQSPAHPECAVRGWREVDAVLQRVHHGGRGRGEGKGTLLRYADTTHLKGDHLVERNADVQEG